MGINMKTISASYAGTCRHCGKPINVGDLIAWRKTFTVHATCHKAFLASQRPAYTMPPASAVEPTTSNPATTISVDYEAFKDEMASWVKSHITSEVAKRVAPQTINVEVKTIAGVKVVQGAHFYFDRLVKLMGAGLSVYIWGPAGSGKTTAALMAAEALGRKAEIDTLDPSTFRSMIQGYLTPTGEKVGTAFTRCWEQGKVYIADEADNAPGHVQTLYNGSLAQRIASLAWGNVEMTEGFSFVGTGNTPGRPTRAFPDRRPMSAAFADRLYFMYWPLDTGIECRAAGMASPPVPERSKGTASPSTWTAYVQALRGWAESNMPTLMITPRASLLGVQALALGESPAEVADGLIFRGCDEEMRAKARAAVQLPS